VLIMPETGAPLTWWAAARLFLIGLEVRAHNAVSRRGANAVVERAGTLSTQLEHGAERHEMVANVARLRTDEDWPADLDSWAWWDRQLEALMTLLTDKENI
jgi:hypothetical protein